METGDVLMLDKRKVKKRTVIFTSSLYHFVFSMRDSYHIIRFWTVFELHTAYALTLTGMHFILGVLKF